MIDLAPGQKRGLPIANPVLVAGGIIGYGDAVPRGLDLASLGGAVVGPILYASRRGTSLPRYAETNGGFVLETGFQNRGLRSVLRHHARIWPRLGCPVIAQVVETDADDLGEMAGRLSGVPGLSGIELVAVQERLDALALSVRQIVNACDLPVFVKLTLAVDASGLQPLVDSGAAGFVIGQALRATLPRSARSQTRYFLEDEPPVQQDVSITGSLFGPLTFALALSALRRVASQGYGCTLIACGGIHTVAQARQALAAGALAVQIDSALWVEPALPGWIAQGLDAG